MSSRLHKIGSIYSRVHGFIRKGLLKEEDKPLWFDAYTHFPPKYEPTYGRAAPEMEIKEILYPEDKIRSKIHKTFSEQLGLINLRDSRKTNSQKWLKSYKEYISKGMSEEEAMTEIKKSIDSSKGTSPNIFSEK